MESFKPPNDFGNFLFKKNIYCKIPLVIGAFMGVAVVLVVLSGYGVLFYYLWPVYLVFVVFFGLATIFQKSFFQFLFNSIIVFLIPTIVYFLSCEIQVFRKSLIRNELNILIDQVNTFYKKNGNFPISLDELNFSTKLLIHTEVFDDEKLNYSALNENDVIVYMGKNGFICVVPVTKKLPISTTRLYRYIWTSKEQYWRYDFSIWTLEIK